MNDATIQLPVTLRADARNLRGHLADNSVQCVITSPPYWGLRKYSDDPDEIGTGSMDKYINDIRAVAREVWRYLADDGLFWLNLGDTASGSGGAGGDYNRGGSKAGRDKWKQGDTRIAPMQWCSVPHRIVHVLQDDGWLLRADICWDKSPQVRPEDVRHVRRPLISKEPIFMLAKSRKHRFFHEGLVELGNVWHVPPSRGKNHAAPFPDEIPRRCILVSTVLDDLVVDPFVGSGTTTRVAHELGRKGLGVDLYS